MDALYFRVSSERQTTENQFQDLLQVAERTAPTETGPPFGECFSSLFKRSNCGAEN